MAGKGAAKKPAAKKAAVQKKAAAPTPAPKKSAPQNKQNRVATLTQKAKSLIQTASDGAIADPAKFKNILGKLKDLDKDKRVKKLRQKKQAAVAASRKPQEEVTSNYIDNSSSTVNTEGTTFLDDSSLYAGMEDMGYTSDGGGGGDTGSYSWNQGYTEDLNKWLSDYQAEQAGRDADYQSMLTDITSQEGQFDPELFRSLLGELESSKRRQKEWNEQSAKAAYKY